MVTIFVLSSPLAIPVVDATVALVGIIAVAFLARIVMTAIADLLRRRWFIGVGKVKLDRFAGGRGLGGSTRREVQTCSEDNELAKSLLLNKMQQVRHHPPSSTVCWSVTGAVLAL